MSTATRDHAKEMIAAGAVKVSYKVMLPGLVGPEAVFAATGLLESEQEWTALADRIYEDPLAGYKGKYLVIPKGIRIATLRKETL